MNERQIIDAALQNLQKNTSFNGVFVPTLNTAKDLDGMLSLEGPEIDLPRFNIEIKATLRQHQILSLMDMAAAHEPFIVVAEKIYPTMKEELRRRKVNYMDGAGNFFIRHKKTLLWLDGHRAPALKKTVNKAFTKTGLKVVFHFLHRKEAFNQTYRDITYFTKVALGNINNIIHGLNDAGFMIPVDKKNFRLLRNKQLLDRWITGYADILRPTLQLGTYRFANTNMFEYWKSLPMDIDHNRWGGEPTADILTNHLHPQILTIYTNDKSLLVREWKLIPDENGPVHLFQKFWTDSIYDMATNIAPVLLVYADLVLSNDPRCIETAHRLYDKFIKNEFEGN